MRHLVLAALFISMFLVLARTRILPEPFGYDEADYMTAARLGLASNFTDSPTLPIVDFIHEGLTRGKAPAQRSALSEEIRNRNDIAVYRHWHGPGYYYWLIFSSQFAHTERGMRLWSLTFPVLSFLILYFGCLWLSPGIEGQIQGILASALFLWGTTAIASTELAPHHAFASCFLLALILLAKMIATGLRRYFYLAVVTAGVAFGTLEMALILILVLIACCFFERHALLPDWRFCLRCVALFAGTVLVVWPGAVLKVSFLKSYLGLAYISVFRKAAWGNITLLDAWVKRLMLSPLEWTLILGTIAIYLIGRQVRTQRMLYPPLIFAALMLAATGRVAAEAPRYALVYLPALDLFAGCVLGSILARRRPFTAYGSAALLALALYGVTVYKLTHWELIEPPRTRAMLTSIQDHRVAEGALLVPQEDVPTIHYYYPKAYLRGYVGQPSPEDRNSRKFDGVLYPGYPVRLEPLN